MTSTDTTTHSPAPQPAPFPVWAVVFSNYDPAEVDSLWSTPERAEAEADAKGGAWHVQRWLVGA